MLNVSNNETTFDAWMSRPFALNCLDAICWGFSWSLLMWSWWERTSGSQRIFGEWKDSLAQADFSRRTKRVREKEAKRTREDKLREQERGLILWSVIFKGWRCQTLWRCL